MNKPAQILYVRLLVALAGGALCAVLSWFHWVSPLDRVIYDFFNEFAAMPVAEDIVIVAIDEHSLAELGRWPWRRENHVELLRQLHSVGVKAVALDILFTEPSSDYPEVDVLLADAMANLDIVVPVFIRRAGPDGWMREMLPIEPVVAAASGLGHVHIEVDDDGVARNVFLKEGLGRARWPHFSVAVANLVGLDTATLPGLVPDESLPDGGPFVIARTHGNLIPFMGPAGTLPQLSYVEVMRGRVDPALLQDKIVFIGATAAGHVDNVTTSYGQISGIEINANIFHALREGRMAQPANPALAAALSFAIVALTILLGTLVQPGTLLLVALAYVVTLPLLSFVVFYFGHRWFSPGPMLITMVFAYPLWSWQRLSSALRFIDGQLENLEQENRQLHIQRVAPADEVRAGADPVDAILRKLDGAYARARENHELLRVILDKLASGVILANTTDDILFLNPQAQQLLGLSDQERFLASALERVELDELPPLSERVVTLQSVGEHFSLEGRSLSAGQDLLLSGAIIDIGQVSLLIVITDVTELKTVERKRVEALNFLSHDLRAPLASVLALIDSARGPDGEGASTALLEEIEKCVYANLSYAENFTQLARLERGGDVNFDRCDAHSLVDNAVAQLFHVARSRGVELQVAYSDEDIWVDCSRDLIERALINLLDNAIKYSAHGRVVSVSLEADAEHAIIAVGDQGEGVSPHDLYRIFEAFEQGAGARSGVGLGLRFVSAVAQVHAGTISASRKPTGGSQFTLTLPRQA